jgi:galactose oxidase
MSCSTFCLPLFIRSRVAFAAVIIQLGVVGVASAQDPSSVGQWSAVQPWPVVAVHAHMLPDGKVLFYPYTDEAYLWDPLTNSLERAAAAGFNIFCSGHTFLADGRLFVTGGHISSSVGLPYSTFYDSVTRTWTRGPEMNAGRWYPTNTMLANGDVLVTAGDTDTSQSNVLPQVLQRSTGTWRDLLNAQMRLDLYPFMHLAPNGKVLYAGPTWHTQYLDTTGSGAWSTIVWGNYYRDYGSSVMYADGKVLNVGGGDPPTETAEVLDLSDSAPAWRAVQSMSTPRRHLNATLLPDHTVLVTGGTSGAGFNNTTTPVYSAELWNPATETWSVMASHSSSVYRGYHSTALLLPDGRVLSAGGDDQPNAQIYSPPYLFKGPRPSIAAAPGAVTYGQTFLVQTPDGGSITDVTWIRLSSVTHAFNQSQRINTLSFTQVANGLSVTAPSDPNLAPPGHYLLFVLNGSGVPSIAKVVRIDAASNLPPDAPSSLTATTVSSSQINLSWTDNAATESGFTVERSADGVSFVTIATLGANATSYQNTGLSPSTTYRYRVSAQNSAGSSNPSNIATATTAAATPTSVAAPTTLTAAAASASQINLAWVDNANNETGYSVERSVNGTTFTQIASLAANVTKYSNTGLAANTRYYYRVRAVSGTLFSSYSNVANVKTRPK